MLRMLFLVTLTLSLLLSACGGKRSTKGIIEVLNSALVVEASTLSPGDPIKPEDSATDKESPFIKRFLVDRDLKASELNPQNLQAARQRYGNLRRLVVRDVENRLALLYHADLQIDTKRCLNFIRVDQNLQVVEGYKCDQRLFDTEEPTQQAADEPKAIDPMEGFRMEPKPQ